MKSSASTWSLSLINTYLEMYDNYQPLIKVLSFSFYNLPHLTVLVSERGFIKGLKGVGFYHHLDISVSGFLLIFVRLFFVSSCQGSPLNTSTQSSLSTVSWTRDLSLSLLYRKLEGMRELRSNVLKGF